MNLCVEFSDGLGLILLGFLMIKQNAVEMGEVKSVKHT